jgi:chromosomal replication initiation ATPase DnaA
MKTEQEFNDRLTRLEKRFDQLLARFKTIALPPDVEPHDGIRTIKNVVSKHYCVPLSAIDSKTRWAEATWARHVVIHLAWLLLDIKDRRLRIEFGMCHTSISNALRNVNNRIETERATKASYEVCRADAKKALGL